jgi:hypothetical protein
MLDRENRCFPCPLLQDRLRGISSLCKWYRSFLPREQDDRNVKLTTHLNLNPIWIDLWSCGSDPNMFQGVVKYSKDRNKVKLQATTAN